MTHIGGIWSVKLQSVVRYRKGWATLAELTDLELEIIKKRYLTQECAFICG